MSEVNLDLEPDYESTSPLPKAGDIAVDFEFTLTTSQKLSLKKLNSRGPVLLNFIKGTWCLFCQQHMFNLRKWQDTLRHKNISLLVISNEEVGILGDWGRENHIDYLLGSATNQDDIFKRYGIDINNHDFPRPATFLIDMDMTIRLVFAGPRGQKFDQAVGKATNTP